MNSSGANGPSLENPPAMDETTNEGPTLQGDGSQPDPAAEPDLILFYRSASVHEPNDPPKTEPLPLRQARILLAAHTLFLERRQETVRLEDIAERAYLSAGDVRALYPDIAAVREGIMKSSLPRPLFDGEAGAGELELPQQ